MKAILIIPVSAMVALAASTFAGCGGASGADPRADVIAAFYPLAFAAQEIGGESVSVRNLTAAGAEPHDLELSPRDVQAVRSADLVLLMGRGFQPQLEKAAGRDPHVLRLLDTPGLDRRAGDPHVWLDPVRFALLVSRIGKALNRPRGATRLVARLRFLDAVYRRGLARCARRDIVTSHAAFGYLAARYRLREVAVTGVSPEAQSTPRELQRVVRAVRRTGATTVFFEPLVSRRLAETVARETGARTAVLDPLEGLTETQARRGRDYFSVMRANLANLRRALGCR
jgi:zinc transport system substrate-binding protein